MAIFNLLNQIKSHEIVLPAIQRNFVWDEQKIVKLLVSILRGYPIGIVLMWETHNDIQYRPFDKSVRLDPPTRFDENTKKQKLQVVLDEVLGTQYLILLSCQYGQAGIERALGRVVRKKKPGVNNELSIMSPEFPSICLVLIANARRCSISQLSSTVLSTSLSVNCCPGWRHAAPRMSRIDHGEFWGHNI